MKKIPFATIVLAIVAGATIMFGGFHYSEARHNDSSLYRKIRKLDDDAVEKIANPIMFGVALGDIQDTFGDPRSGGRTHEGVDIFAPRGAIIASPTEAVVTKIADKGLGGIQVWTANPGGHSYYYAHMNGVFEDLEVGDELDAGDIIGFVGDTGNAQGTSPHLHFGIYTNDREVLNPYEMITKNFSNKKKISLLEDYIEFLQDKLRREKR